MEEIEKEIDRALLIAEQLEEAHIVVKELLGNSYYEDTADIRDCLGRIIEDHGITITEAGLLLLRFIKNDPKFDGTDMMLAMGVIYDMQAEDFCKIKKEDLGL